VFRAKLPSHHANLVGGGMVGSPDSQKTEFSPSSKTRCGIIELSLGGDSPHARHMQPLFTQPVCRGFTHCGTRCLTS
jgi:hypothetical protein